jgi:hypothetical protein
MNAHELASEIQNCEDDYYNLDAATMLRQQAEEIESLKAITVPCQICGCDPTRYEMRDLTDEEIMQVWKYSPWDGEDMFLFARAILKKAREK